MSDSCSSTATLPQRRGAVIAPILGTVSFSFATYINIGLALAVLPGFVHHTLGYSATLAGLAISMQYLATLLSRPHVGRMTDSLGPKLTVLSGLVLCAVSGGLLLTGALLAKHAALSLGVILLSRLALGCAESCVGTGAITWGMGQVGHQHTARVISWNGVATYGGLAAGAPLGVLIAQRFGFDAIGATTVLLMLLALPLARRRPATAVAVGERSPFRAVAAHVVPYGMGLALGSIGFGCIATFITLFFAERGWAGAAGSLSVFGIMFVGSRFVFARSIPRLGGYRVAMISFVVEALGLLVLWLAGSALIAATGAALAGLGFSLVFPALGVEAVQRIPAHSRGAAIGVFSVFLDVAMAIAGPLGGWVSAGMGFAAIYAFAAVAALLAVALTWLLHVQAQRAPAGPAA
ncbi:MFS transporter [Dyella sp. A6]|uniref:MFS transporter n=1 Tax=Dyella aluminiiresistens TaxID=3069105 RepID=UPI002E75DB50|nr:MFS transporter [Dyella sp. A6]